MQLQQKYLPLLHRLLHIICHTGYSYFYVHWNETKSNMYHFMFVPKSRIIFRDADKDDSPTKWIHSQGHRTLQTRIKKAQKQLRLLHLKFILQFNKNKLWKWFTPTDLMTRSDQSKKSPKKPKYVLQPYNELFQQDTIMKTKLLKFQAHV